MNPKILLQLDTDPQPSVFDAVVAIDAGVEHLLQYGDVTPKNVVGLVHGAIFTRGPEQLQSTAIFIGGSDLHAGEKLLEKITQTMFDPLRVSVVLDSNGANSTACAAVLSAAKHFTMKGCNALVLGATGAVGQQVCHLLAVQGATSIAVGSRDAKKAQAVCATLKGCQCVGFAYDDESAVRTHLNACDVIFACGAAGVELLSVQQLEIAEKAKVAIDLNAVPPVGIATISATDKAMQRGERFDYGALGVGGLKMKIHKSAIKSAFGKRGLVIDADVMLEIGSSL